MDILWLIWEVFYWFGWVIWQAVRLIYLAGWYLIEGGSHKQPRFGLIEAPRSSRWPEVRRAHIKKQPCCAACGRNRNLAVHHKLPYHLFPALELVDSNLITLCASCHLVFGHFGDWHAYNPNVVDDAESHRQKMVHNMKYDK